MIEWKTSRKQKSTLKACYDYPLQAVAYAGALNYDDTFNIEVGLKSVKNVNLKMCYSGLWKFLKGGGDRDWDMKCWHGTFESRCACSLLTLCLPKTWEGADWVPAKVMVRLVSPFLPLKKDWNMQWCSQGLPGWASPHPEGQNEEENK